MLDLKNLILNSSIFPDTSSTVQNDLKSEQLIDIHEDSDSDGDLLTPESFILLMAEILSTNSTDTTYEYEHQNSEGNKVLPNLQFNEIKVDEHIQEHNEQLKSSDNQLCFSTELPDVNEITGNQYTGQFESTIEKNVALTWINSENFQPPIIKPESQTNETYKIWDSEIASIESGKLKLDFPKAGNQENNINSYQKEATNQLQSDLLKNHQLVKEGDAFPTLEEIKMNLEPGSEVIRSGIEVGKVGSEIPGNSYQMPPKAGSDIHPPVASNNYAPKNFTIPIHVNHSQWSNQLSEHIVWLGHQEVKSALIKIHPEELGPLEINVNVVKDNASVNISTHSVYVKEIVDQALPRLREMMAQQGINLSEVHIGTDTNSRQYSQKNHNVDIDLVQSAEDKNKIISLTKHLPKGLVDYFA
ncbi:flagellar hook-length control protein FliK [Legionella pneumophila]|uniref:Flagellar hook-length control protein FliK n=1 Tax=Legionella pneumophila subsp. pascullei TaxID=91890 RepID=A0AAX2IY46_LEGPN|nr:flagellar hook-length control protein FliK [Legionella pneumophila]AMP92673.1 flagellar hook-length control protein FliK [Legionella pneumophila subsp. pascullei]SQG90549.1 flagellar hook-length control protein FliK [Legionella pneumophila subsp. pascullei]VEH07094.1 flagellar hook-length control protein FliK [Legionella pneumophila subsp. pascullei]HAU3860455.1 flagellar hook-length control protein FliK [Legionella pneumophila]HDU8259185.1 flagellar hook-length control protein FliK [Legion